MASRAGIHSLVFVATASCVGNLSSTGAERDDRDLPPPAGAPDGGTPPGEAPPASSFHVLISELMYHPVVDDAPDSTYEFVEIYNAMTMAVPLEGWKLDGMVHYTFPAGASIEAGEYLVIAKDRQKVANAYKLAADKVLGDYAGELANGGGKPGISLLDAMEWEADTVIYDDTFPWPIGPDALGAKAQYFAAPDTRADLGNYRHKGISLERISFDVATGELSNWAPCAIDETTKRYRPTPAEVNSVNGTPKPIVVALSVGRKQDDGPILAGDDVLVTARLSTLGTVRAVDVEWFIDQVDKSGEKTTVTSMTAAGDHWEAVIPAATAKPKDNDIVRYRIRGDRGSGREIISPRPSDPNPWHAYFITPPQVINDGAKMKTSYQLFISPSSWGKMWTNVGAPATATGIGMDTRGSRATGPISTELVGCNVRASFDAEVPAVFVNDGIVYDVLVRYQGSEFNRLRGEKLKAWPYPGPMAGPTPPLILSWNVSFPKYRSFETTIGGDKVKRTSIDIKKVNYWSCPAFSGYIANKLMESPDVGLSSARLKFVRYYINGGYYGYMADLGPVDEATTLRTEPAGSTDVVGDLIKANGSYETGPWAETSAAPLAKSSTCPEYEVWQRYQYNYERQTYGWKETAITNDPRHPADDAQKLIEGLDLARVMDGGKPAKMAKKFLGDNFVIEKLRDYIAIRNWAGPTDFMQHNYNLYKRASDGRWLIIGWDFELEYGGAGLYPFYASATGIKPAESFYLGEKDNTDSYPGGMWNRIYDAYFKGYKAQYNQRLRELSQPGRILDPATFSALVDRLAAEFDTSDFNEAQIEPLTQEILSGQENWRNPVQCDPPKFFAAMKQWARDRNAALLEQIPP